MEGSAQCNKELEGHHEDPRSKKRERERRQEQGGPNCRGDVQAKLEEPREGALRLFGRHVPADGIAQVKAVMGRVWLFREQSKRPLGVE